MRLSKELVPFPALGVADGKLGTQALDMRALFSTIGLCLISQDSLAPVWKDLEVRPESEPSLAQGNQGSRFRGHLILTLTPLSAKKSGEIWN